jgi:hypothetical protein
MESGVGADHAPARGLTMGTPRVASRVLGAVRGTALGAALGGALIAATAPGRVAHGRDTMQTKPCGSAEYHQFDFFAGDWDAYDVGAPTKVVARNRVTPMLDGCALREVYEEPGGHKGESFSTYDVGRRRWHQSWVTNDGQILQLDGHLDGNRMVLTATETLATGTQRLVRGIWYPDSSGVRETGERSSDGGKTWTPWFDIIFRPHGQP